MWIRSVARAELTSAYDSLAAFRVVGVAACTSSEDAALQASSLDVGMLNISL